MILDFEPRNGNYILRVPRRTREDEAAVQAYMTEYGLDLSMSASTATEAVLFTFQPYAAAPFWEFATDRAKADPQLQWICREIELSRAPESGRHFDVPEDEELSGYQKADLEYMLARKDNAGVLDADEPGLGKTCTSIVYANELRARRVLIICPASIRYQWLGQWQRWSTMPSYLPGGANLDGYAVTSSKYGLRSDVAVTVTSPELARAEGIHEALMAQDFDLIIRDEAHGDKTTSSARSRALWGGELKRGKAKFHTEGLASRSRYGVVALTGTPLPNRPKEAFVLAHNLCQQSIDYMTEHAFGERFNPMELKEVQVQDKDTGLWQTKVYQDESSGRHAELQARMRAHFMCRHLKRDVLTQLRLPQYDLVRADETSAVKAALRAESLLDIDPDTLTGAHADVLGHIAEARRLMGLALAPQAANYAAMLLEGGVEKLVIFYWHIEVGDILSTALKHHLNDEFAVARVDGSSTPLVKEAQKELFLTSPRCRVMMGNVLTLGTGTDGLQDVASYCVIAEPDWVPGNNVQCVDRLDRRGQSQTVNADIFVAPNSIAERVLASALRKAKVTHATLDRRIA